MLAYIPTKSYHFLTLNKRLKSKFHEESSRYAPEQKGSTSSRRGADFEQTLLNRKQFTLCRLKFNDFSLFQARAANCSWSQTLSWYVELQMGRKSQKRRGGELCGKRGNGSKDFIEAGQVCRMTSYLFPRRFILFRGIIVLFCKQVTKKATIG